MASITIEKHLKMDEKTLNTIEKLDREIFDKPYSRETILESISGKTHLLILLAMIDGVCVGYKAGYAINDKTFYSWIGGVSPTQRKLGIASQLMRAQHQEIKLMGFKKVRTKTKNKFRAMLLLNIRWGFNIVDTYPGSDDLLRIVLEKDL